MAQEERAKSGNGSEKRKHPRISLDVQVSCVSLDKLGTPLDQNKGYLKDVSQGGVGIEADEKPRSDHIVAVFTDSDSQPTGMLGKVAYTKQMANGKHWIGLSFLGEPLLQECCCGVTFSLNFLSDAETLTSWPICNDKAPRRLPNVTGFWFFANESAGA